MQVTVIASSDVIDVVIGRFPDRGTPWGSNRSSMGRGRREAGLARFLNLSHGQACFHREVTPLVHPRQDMEGKLYTKTPRAWEALARPDGLDRRAHTLLLMANGRRSLRELSRLLGEDVRDLAFCLSSLGYLQDSGLTPLEALDDDQALST